jgi:hypothetical protein
VSNDSAARICRPSVLPRREEPGHISASAGPHEWGTLPCGFSSCRGESRE